MNNKMSNWFKLPVKCEHILGDDIGSAKDAISIRNVAILSSHHVEKAAHAINSHDRLTARVAELEGQLSRADTALRKAHAALTSGGELLGSVQQKITKTSEKLGKDWIND